MGKNDLTGRWGEGLAADYLRRRGYRLLACNYRCRFGEIDIIAEKRGCVVFCEVKTRQDDRFAQAMEFVDSHKQRRLRATAEFISTLKTVERVEVLPYHAFGMPKWEKLGLDYTLKDASAPTEEQVKRAEEILNVSAYK